ncbi:hypothetical protein Pvag_3331 [Pantoea vagans C9-1]|nr:hypothetical protein Pvag_3331 [Pantoea vagans C9-1]
MRNPAKATHCFFSVLLLTQPFLTYPTVHAARLSQGSSKHAACPDAASALPCALLTQLAQ